MDIENNIDKIEIDGEPHSWVQIFWKEKCPSCGNLGYWLLDQFHCKCFEDKDS